MRIRAAALRPSVRAWLIANGSDRARPMDRILPNTSGIQGALRGYALIMIAAASAERATRLEASWAEALADRLLKEVS